MQRVQRGGVHQAVSLPFCGQAEGGRQRVEHLMHPVDIEGEEAVHPIQPRAQPGACGGGIAAAEERGEVAHPPQRTPSVAQEGAQRGVAFGHVDGGGLHQRAVARAVEGRVRVEAVPAEMRGVPLIVVAVHVVRLIAPEAR